MTLRCLTLICRVHEANRLRAELTVARMAERAAREKYQDFMRTSSMYGVSASVCAPCGLRGCKNRAYIIFWPEVVKGGSH